MGPFVAVQHNDRLGEIVCREERYVIKPIRESVLQMVFSLLYWREVPVLELRNFVEWIGTSELRIPEFFIKREDRSFNHVCEYAIHDHQLWVRSRGVESASWQKMPFDGQPVSISVDGANLMVLDRNGEVHYKKVLRESRSDSHYCFADKSSKENWKERWFTLPIVHYMVNWVTAKRLKLPTDIRAWAVSHRGQFNSFAEDAHGREHVDQVGVTTLFTLDAHGKEIYFYDPWMPKHVEIKVHVPETASTAFEAMNLSVAASTLMIIGYEECGGVKRAKLYTQMADLDTLGWNPMKSFCYDKGEGIAIPLNDWREHSLPHLYGKARFTSQITILQTGQGNGARELRIEGFDSHDTPGFYYKSLNDSDWQFHQLPDDVLSEDGVMEVESKIERVEIRTNAKHFCGEIKLDDSSYQIQVHDFIKHKTRAKVTVVDPAGRTYSALLYRREQIIPKLLTFGREFPRFDIVFTDDIWLQLPSDLRGHFGSRVVSAGLRISEHSLTVWRSLMPYSKQLFHCEIHSIS